MSGAIAIYYRGSGSDLATDVLSVLDATERRRFLEQFEAVEPGTVAQLQRQLAEAQAKVDMLLAARERYVRREIEALAREHALRGQLATVFSVIKDTKSTRGKPQPEEYVDGGPSYQLAITAYIRLCQALDQLAAAATAYEARIKGPLERQISGLEALKADVIRFLDEDITADQLADTLSRGNKMRTSNFEARIRQEERERASSIAFAEVGPVLGAVIRERLRRGGTE